MCPELAAVRAAAWYSVSPNGGEMFGAARSTVIPATRPSV